MLHTDNAKTTNNVFLLCGILLLNHIYNHSIGLAINIFYMHRWKIEDNS